MNKVIVVAGLLALAASQAGASKFDDGIDAAVALKQAKQIVIAPIPAARKVAKNAPASEEEQRAWMEAHKSKWGERCDGWNTGRSYSSARFPRACRVVEYPIRIDQPDFHGWIDPDPGFAHWEMLADESNERGVYPSLDGKLWICHSPESGGASCIFGPPDAYDRFSKLSAAAQRLFVSKDWNDDVRLLGIYSWPDVKKILAGEKRDCRRAAARLAKAEDQRLHPDEWALQDVYDSAINTSYGRNGYGETTKIRFENGLAIHPIQVIHERNGVHKLDDYTITLDAASCRLAGPIEPGEQVLNGWSRDGRGGATEADFIGDPNQIPTPGAAERAVWRRKLSLPEASSSGASALRQRSAPAQALGALFGEQRVRAAFAEIDRLQAVKLANPDAYQEFLRSPPSNPTVGNVFSDQCNIMAYEDDKARLIEADRDDSAPQLDADLYHKCLRNMIEIYGE